MQPPRGAVLGIFLLLALGFAGVYRSTGGNDIQGVVVDGQGPVADALVRWQGHASCTWTDAQGRFRLRGPRQTRPITAAKEGYLIASATVDKPLLQLQPVPQDDNDDYAWIDPVPDPRLPLNCGNCHRQIFDEWAASAHSHSATNPKFLYLVAGTDGKQAESPTWNLMKEHPLGSGVCASCHAPTLTSPDLDYDVRQATGVHRRGVHCDYCHKIADAPTDKLGTRFGRDGYRLVRPHGDLQLFFGPLDDAVRPGDAFVYAPFYKESRYCGSCHEGVIFGVHVYGTYSEWLASPAPKQGKQCQDCHMAPTGTMTNIAPGKGGIERDPRTLASHHVPGATHAMLQRCLRVKTAVSRRDRQVFVTVTTQAHDVGHRVPTGFIDRHLILTVEARNQREESLAPRAGPVLPDRAGKSLAGRAGWIYGKQHLHASGQPLPFWLDAAELLDTRLESEVADERQFTFPAEAVSVRVRLVYRRFWDVVAQSRAWADNELVVFEETRHVGREQP
jgi:hypothetical protein